MANDEDVRKEVWNGKIPVLFRLCPSDVFLTEQPEPLYMAVMRQSYFPLVFSEKIHKYYKRYIDPDLTEANIWLEDNNGMPVQWHWPIGVLFDLNSLTKVDLPWVITVHYKDFPQNNIIRFTSRDAVESLYMSNLKEADFLKHRGQLINVMQRHEIKMLFQGLNEGNYEKFWSVNEKFMECSETNKFRYIPIRLHIKHDIIKQYAISNMNNENTANPLISINQSDERLVNINYLTQGIKPPLDTPLLWLSRRLSYPDNFLHICLLDLPS
ncbi:hypothetical protein HELRODRAFT_65487 [Helobdella robusta]|uniref:Autophagy protein 5 n=1 Tax=Helobdella robusta TaxID=6412 RepID=T1FY85_HELRO|nr:hypothetical protein HELRODRAFT_65487 [Helobdella robusta]ESO02583.1 hypothetical protein HELRODRAFT_65487 [Helobdella robusta]